MQPRPLWSLSTALRISIMLVGGILTGWGPSSRIMPGGWEVEGDSRSVDHEGIAAARWTQAELPQDSRFATDRTGRVLLGAFGEQHPLTIAEDGVDVSPLYFAPAIGAGELHLLERLQLQYVEVDLRMSEGLPVFGVYFEDTEPGALAHTTPIPSAALEKFDGYPGTSRLFDAGDIAIYDVRQLDGHGG